MAISLSCSHSRICSSIFVLLMVLGACCGLLCSQAQASSKSAGYYARVVKIIDGDSIAVKSGNSLREIRLWGIDSPEWDQPYSRQAKNFLRTKLLDKRVYLEPLYLDKYDRTIAQVFLSGANVSRLLVEKGYAWVHIYYCNKKICSAWKKLEREARKSRTGLWGKKRPVAPWQWKKMKKARRR